MLIPPVGARSGCFGQSLDRLIPQSRRSWKRNVTVMPTRLHLASMEVEQRPWKRRSHINNMANWTILADNAHRFPVSPPDQELLGA
jgi:hypothetical protein